MSSGFWDLPPACPASWDCGSGRLPFFPWLLVCFSWRRLPEKDKAWLGRIVPLSPPSLSLWDLIASWVRWLTSVDTLLGCLFWTIGLRGTVLGSPPEEKIDKENNTVIDNHCYPFGTKEDSMRTPSKVSWVVCKPKSALFAWLLSR